VDVLTASYASWRPGCGSPVSISLSTPRWLPAAADWPRCWLLTPRWAYFHAEPGEFERAYLAQLARYGPERISRCLARIAREAYQAPSQRLVLCCWETDWANCHRRQFAEWLLVTTGELVTELKEGK
jgi:hypothetical protein